MIKLIFAGDIIPICNHQVISSDLCNTISNAELSFVNLEAPITDSKTSIEKIGNNFKVDTKTGLNALEKLPFTTYCLANNHIMDYGRVGLTDTVKTIKKTGRNFLGAGNNIAQAYKIFDYNAEDLKLGFINVTENEFSSATEINPGAAGFDLIKIIELVSQYREQYNHLFLIYHGGIEYYPYPSPRIRKLFQFLIDAGVSGIIAHHSHVFTCYETYKGNPIFYGIGNFYAPTNRVMKSEYYESALIELDISKAKILCDVKPIKFELKKSQVRFIRNNELELFLSEVNKRNDVLKDDTKILANWNKFLAEKKYYYSDIVGFSRLRILKKLRRIGILPQANFSSRKALYLLNLLRCEAHNEAITGIIEREINNK